MFLNKKKKKPLCIKIGKSNFLTKTKKTKELKTFPQLLKNEGSNIIIVGAIISFNAHIFVIGKCLLGGGGSALEPRR